MLDIFNVGEKMLEIEGYELKISAQEKKIELLEDAKEKYAGKMTEISDAATEIKRISRKISDDHSDLDCAASISTAMKPVVDSQTYSDVSTKISGAIAEMTAEITKATSKISYYKKAIEALNKEIAQLLGDD